MMRAMGQQAVQEQPRPPGQSRQPGTRKHRRWRREAYPADWERIATEAKARAHWKCEHCGLSQGALAVNARGALYTICLAACHVDHSQIGDPAATLLILCKKCHCIYDAQVRVANRRRYAVERQVQLGQMALL